MSLTLCTLSNIVPYKLLVYIPVWSLILGYQTLICFNGTFKISCYMLVVYSLGLRKGTTVCALYETLYIIMYYLFCSLE